MAPEEPTKNRLTIMLDRDLEAKIRKVQAELITSETGSWSFSTVLNDVLANTIKGKSVKSLAEKVLKTEGVN